MKKCHLQKERDDFLLFCAVLSSSRTTAWACAPLSAPAPGLLAPEAQAPAHITFLPHSNDPGGEPFEAVFAKGPGFRGPHTWQEREASIQVSERPSTHKETASSVVLIAGMHVRIFWDSYAWRRT